MISGSTLLSTSDNVEAFDIKRQSIMISGSTLLSTSDNVETFDIK